MKYWLRVYSDGFFAVHLSVAQIKLVDGSSLRQPRMFKGFLWLWCVTSLLIYDLILLPRPYNSPFEVAAQQWFMMGVRRLIDRFITQGTNFSLWRCRRDWFTTCGHRNPSFLELKFMTLSARQPISDEQINSSRHQRASHLYKSLNF